ncbi:hypothetical protein PSN45_003792 [Yamadazyma tenuis]|uniref:Uncharacterized protein n=1 Tax=Candida tenuis (strain ATCC 10573 / BCRC 21748 / CBS 615 / JCM 9827 / NBRC 10315 / NRRL Y-1498 / VKM Y-70) TaxID=590646 RepID=G3B387_CANTC|nr:uncharacterized protein CANTEDRAFT_114140 [Yamadazyma tenuis ATCC 10573]XP_006686684.1 uncharacterized protein CANTEDRAFT_114140 [Yamadazyma tenuis ATCC 10573]EGV64369.1 hypothetical protein CANTEDRAFT_114140 [Yamadazyma tenuis ATCC 10573]EGV64370.1 hypothetical protein CANTEDRAFT_114140 [Yamadazyma tenuis ATCC 10573]WEJ96256.1 hypothetical protein PSN45_003792 [Yamadazyma tenuis]
MSDNYSHPPEDPPSYTESTHQQQSVTGPSSPPLSDNITIPQKAPQYEGNNEYPPEKQQPPPNGKYDPMADPKVYKVPPQLVNITQANPQHLNPSYPQYQEREQQRLAQGHAPNPARWKHGAPLEPGKTNPSHKTGGSSFPGRGGATYNNAANK